MCHQIASKANIEYSAGTFGKVDAMSEILTEYLQRLEEQQESVMHLIKNQLQLLKEGKAAASLQLLKQTAAQVSSWLLACSECPRVMAAGSVQQCLSAHACMSVWMHGCHTHSCVSVSCEHPLAFESA